jgi:hypothetical protein
MWSVETEQYSPAVLERRSQLNVAKMEFNKVLCQRGIANVLSYTALSLVMRITFRNGMPSRDKKRYTSMYGRQLLGLQTETYFCWVITWLAIRFIRLRAGKIKNTSELHLFRSWHPDRIEPSGGHFLTAITLYFHGLNSPLTQSSNTFFKRFIAQKIQRDTRGYKIVPLTNLP